MNQKIKRTREYRNCYRESKEQIKKHVCRASYTDRKYLKKKIVLMNEDAQINCINDILTKK